MFINSWEMSQQWRIQTGVNPTHPPPIYGPNFFIFMQFSMEKWVYVPHIVINFRALLPHMYGDINKLFQCFVELMFFYFLFAHNIYSKLQHCFSIFKPSQCRALQSISEFSQCKPKCLKTVQVACPQH